MKTENFNCDICKKTATIKDKTIQVIFQTYQEDWQWCNPYLDTVKMDLCVNCMEEILSWKWIFAWGAMWYNNYSFINK